MTADWVSRFWAKVEKTEGCWLWTGGVDSKGYGAIKIAGRQTGAHRASYELARGSIPAGIMVRHACDTPRCVRPDHLELGSHTDNMQDMRTRGRAAPGDTSRFEANPDWRQKAQANNANGRKTHCPKGHEYTPGNTRLERGRRHCKTCERRTCAA